MPKDVKHSYDELAKVLAYDPETGAFTWKVSLTSRAQAGCRAGVWQRMQNGKDYFSVTYQGVKMSGARLAWVLHYGEWPDRSVFYDDEDPTNLRIANLKLADHKAERVVGDDGKVKYRTSTEAVRHYGLMRNYGISYTEYAQMFAEQNGVCAICEKPETSMIPGRKRAEGQQGIRDLSVDHDHVTGAVRGLLCNGCNHMLGEVNDDREILVSAIKYLDKHSGATKAPALSVVKGDE